MKDTVYRVLDFCLKRVCIIPQKYSFMVFGSHGVGMHAFLYYLSLCKEVFPLPWFILCKDRDWFAKREDCISLRFLLYYMKNHRMFDRYLWGLTFERAMNDRRWIERNCLLKVPAFSLVRDPVSIITTQINYSLFNLIYQSGRASVDYGFAELQCRHHMKLIVNFRSNLEPLREKCTLIHYIDTLDLIGECAQKTMKEVGSILQTEVKENCLFGKSINGVFQRVFPQSFCIDGISFRVSPFSDMFSLSISELAYKQVAGNIYTTYRSKIFPEETLYIVTQFSGHISMLTQQKLFDTIDIFLLDLLEKNSLYQRYKHTDEETIEFLSSLSFVDEIKRVFRYEIDDLMQTREDLVGRWRSLHQFMPL